MNSISITDCESVVIDIISDTDINDSTGNIIIGVGLNSYRSTITSNEAGHCRSYTTSQYEILKSWGISKHYYQLSVAALVCGVLSMSSLLLFQIKKKRFNTSWFLHVGVVGLLITAVMQSFLAATFFPIAQDICSPIFMFEVLLQENSMASTENSISCKHGFRAMMFYAAAIAWDIAFGMILFNHGSLTHRVEQRYPEEDTSLESGSYCSDKTGSLSFPIPVIIEVADDLPAAVIIEKESFRFSSKA